MVLQSKYDTRKYSVSVKVPPIWYSLSERVVSKLINNSKEI